MEAAEVVLRALQAMELPGLVVAEVAETAQDQLAQPLLEQSTRVVVAVAVVEPITLPAQQAAPESL
jgi:hypothetical protein